MENETGYSDAIKVGKVLVKSIRPLHRALSVLKKLSRDAEDFSKSEYHKGLIKGYTTLIIKLESKIHD